MDSQSKKIVWDPYTPGYFEDPYAHLKACREGNPVHQVLGNSWILLRYKDVSSILSSDKFRVFELSKFFEEKESSIFRGTNACPFLSKGTRLWPMYLNDESHKRTRAAMLKSFNLKDLDKDLPGFVDSVNRQFSGQAQLDLVTYCAQYVFLVVQRILGVQHLEFSKIKEYSNWLARSQDLYMPKQLYREVNSWLLWGKDVFKNSTFEKNVKEYSSRDKAPISEDDAYSISALALMAAFETSKDNLAVALWAMLLYPTLMEYVEECDTDELDLLIDELFRFTSPLQYTVRINTLPVEYESACIPAHSKLYLCLASANRDDRAFERPDEIMVKRNPNAHLAFGKGSHHCLGANVAKLEMMHCLKPMARFLRSYQLTPGNRVRWSRQIMMRTVESITLDKKHR